MTREEILGFWQPTIDNLIDKIRLIADDAPGLDTPGWSGTFVGPNGPVEEKGQTPRELLVHLVVSCYDVPVALATQAGFEGVKAAHAELAGAAPSALAAALEARREKLVTFIQGLTDEQLATVAETPLGAHSVASLLATTSLHVVHHKGQLSIVLRQLGLRPGRFHGR